MKTSTSSRKDRSTAEQEFSSLLHQAFMGGRWALFVAEAAVALLVLDPSRTSPAAVAALAILALYNVAALFALHRLFRTRSPVLSFLAADLLFIGVVVALTGGLGSPFAGLFYLVGLTGAVYYDVVGGLAVALAACGILIATSIPGLNAGPSGGELTPDSGALMTQMIPYLILHGAVAGYLVGQLKRLQERRREFEERLLQRQYEERIRQQEMDIARRVQCATLPELPAHPEYGLAVRFVPAREVGGDFYSFFTEGERLGLIVGDVSGKGIPAALVSTSVSHLVRQLPVMRDPTGFLAELNRVLLEQIPEDTFASMVLVVADPAERCLTFYNAGHPPPLVIRRGASSRVERANLLLGVSPEARFAPESIEFESGDTLVLYSDAFIEAVGPSGEMLSIEGLESLVRRHAALPPEPQADRLIEDTRAFGRVTDDLTLLILKAQ